MFNTLKKDDIYFIAMKLVFWILVAGVLIFATLQAWPIMRRILDVLTPFIVGLVLAYLFHPIVRVVQFRLKLGRVAGILVIASVLLLLFLGFFAVLVPILYTQGKAAVDGISGWVSSGSMDEQISRFLPGDAASRGELTDYLRTAIEDLRTAVEDILESKPDILKPMASGGLEALKTTLGILGSIFGWVGGVAAMLMLALIAAFYYLLEMSKIPVIARHILPGDQRRLWDTLIEADRSVGGFLRGQLIACSGVGFLASAFLFMIGLQKYAILIGFTAGAVNFIPYLGPTVGAAPAILWALFAQDLPGWTETTEMPMWGVRLTLSGMVVGAFAIIQMVDGFIFQPYIVGKSAALHPLAVMVSLVVGAQFGVGGMIIAVPLACIVKVFFVEYYWKHTEDFLDAESHPAEAGAADSTDGGGSE